MTFFANRPISLCHKWR